MPSPSASSTLPSATDPVGRPVTYGPDTTLPENGSVIVNADGTYTYTPDANFNGTDRFTYAVSDGEITSTYTVTVTVGEGLDLTIDEDGTAQGHLPQATDPDGDPLTYGLGSQASHGAVVINADGTYRYVQAIDFSGTDSFVYTVSDGTTTVRYTIAITVISVNDPPVGEDAAVTTLEDTIAIGRLPQATDPEGSRLTYGLGPAPTHGTVSVNADSTYRYAPNQNFNGTDTFTYTVSDGTATPTYTVTITVDPVNDPPTASDTAISVTEGTSVSGNLPPAFDTEGQLISYGLGTGPRHGTVTINPDGTYTYTPAEGYNGSDSFIYTVSDGTNTATYTVTVTVDPVEGPEEPRPPLEVDPPPPISAEPTDPRQPPSASDGIAAGFPLPISSIMDDLDGIADLTAQGPIVNVVNSTRSLNGIGWLPEQGSVTYAANQIGDWMESGRIIDDLTAGFFKGGSNIHLERDGTESTWFRIDAMVHNDYLYIMPSSDGDVENAAFGVTLADGRPLPDWLRSTRQGLVIGRPPAGLPYIDLRVHGSSPDGVISDTIRIDLHTGAILDHVSDRRTELGPAMFSDHLLAAAPSGADDDASSPLALALGRWSELPVP